MMPYLTDDGILLLALLSHSRTITQIKENPMVEICYVDRKMAFCRVTGKGAISNSLENKEIVFSNIPMLRQYFTGSQDPNFTLIEIKIESAEAMTPSHKMPDNLRF